MSVFFLLYILGVISRHRLELLPFIYIQSILFTMRKMICRSMVLLLELQMLYYAKVKLFKMLIKL